MGVLLAPLGGFLTASGIALSFLEVNLPVIAVALRYFCQFKGLNTCRDTCERCVDPSSVGEGGNTLPD